MTKYGELEMTNNLVFCSGYDVSTPFRNLLRGLSCVGSVAVFNTLPTTVHGKAFGILT